MPSHSGRPGQAQKRGRGEPTVAELKELCKEKKIKGYSKWNKAKLLAECGDPN